MYYTTAHKIYHNALIFVQASTFYTFLCNLFVIALAPNVTMLGSASPSFHNIKQKIILV